MTKKTPYTAGGCVRGEKMSRKRFYQSAQYLEPSFKIALAKHRWARVIPNELDMVTNPVLRHRPDAFRQVLTPKELCEFDTVDPWPARRLLNTYWRKDSRQECVKTFTDALLGRVTIPGDEAETIIHRAFVSQKASR